MPWQTVTIVAGIVATEYYYYKCVGGKKNIITKTTAKITTAKTTTAKITTATN
jgi:hypothetical protein